MSKQESKIKVLFRSGRIDLVKNHEGEMKLRSDRPGTLRRLIGNHTEILRDRTGYYSKIQPEAAGILVVGLLE